MAGLLDSSNSLSKGLLASVPKTPAPVKAVLAKQNQVSFFPKPDGFTPAAGVKTTTPQQAAPGEGTIATIKKLPGQIKNAAIAGYKTNAEIFSPAVLKEIPQQLSEQVGQPALRAYAGIGGLLSGNTLTPSTKFEKDLYGTDKPLTLGFAGASNFPVDEKSPFAAPLGLLAGAGDLIPGGDAFRGVKGITKLVKAAKTAEEVAPLLKQANFTDDIIREYAPILAKLTDEKKIQEGLQAAEKLQNTTKGSVTASQGLLPAAQDLHTVKAQQALTEAKGLSASDIMAKHPDINLKRDVPITDIRGNKATIPAGEALTPYELKGNKVLLQDGATYIVSKNQYANIKGNAVSGEAKAFAPELTGTEETVHNSVTKTDKEGNIIGNTPTKYSQYTLPDGKNYKEILIKAPTRENSPYDLLGRDGKSLKTYPNYKEAFADYSNSIREGKSNGTSLMPQNPVPEFQSSHWSEPNVISHLRMNERTHNGKKVSFMEELQSDWAREGRAKGFARDVVQQGKDFSVFDKEMRAKYKSDGIPLDKMTTDEVANYWKLQKDALSSGIPNHPLLKNWQVPTVKRALKEAVDSGAEYFSWINGEQTSARYNLATHIDDVHWKQAAQIGGTGYDKQIVLNPKGQGSWILNLSKDGEVLATSGGAPESLRGKKLDEIVGKGLADSIMSKDTGTLSGEGLKFGGEWANTLYDKQVKNIVEDVTGGKVENMDLGLPTEKTKKFDLLRDSTGARAVDLTPKNMSVGATIHGNNVDYIITDVLGDGKFKAVPKKALEDKLTSVNVDYNNLSTTDQLSYAEHHLPTFFERNSQSFDISSKPSTQQGIRLTPEIIAKIKGEAPILKKPSGRSPLGGDSAQALAGAAVGGSGQNDDGKQEFDPSKAAIGGAAGLLFKKHGGQATKYVEEQLAKRRLARGSEGVLSKAKSFLADAKAKIVDSTSPIEDILYKATRKEPLLPSQDIHNQIDRVLRAPTLAGQFAKDNGMVDIIRKVDNIDNLDQYLIAKHAIELNKAGVETGRDLEKDSALIAEFAPKYEKFAEQVKSYSQALLDKSVETGLISKDLADTLKAKYPDYVPFQRVFDEVEKTQNYGTGAVASLSKQSVVKSIEGSKREIESPIESLLAKTNDVFTQGEKNVAGKLLAGYEKLPNNPFDLKELEPGESAPHTISYLDGGVKRTFSTTPEIAAAAKSLNVQQLNILGKILALPVRIARLGITGINLPFVAANIAKDQVSAFINTDHALRTSLANPTVFLPSLFNAVGHGKLYEDWIRAGGGGTSFDLARNQVAESVGRIRAGKNIGTRIAYTVRHPSELLRAAENIIGRSEELTRMQQFAGTKQALIKKGLGAADVAAGAARQSREATVNFARRGEWGTVLNSAWLYLNASIQGTRTLLRNLKEKPVQTSAKIAIAAMMPVAYATSWNLSDPKRKAAYDDISDYEKENNIIIVPPNPTKDDQGRWNVIKIPLSQEINNLVGLARKPIEDIHDNNPLGFKDFAKALIGTISPVAPDKGSIMSAVVPQAVKPTIEATTNTNLFTGKHPITQGLEKLPPKLQVKPWTSGTARIIGNKLNLSPIKVEEWIKATFGGVGAQALNVVDQELASKGIIPKDQIGGQDVLDAITARFNKAQGGKQAQEQYDAQDAAAQKKAEDRAAFKSSVYDKVQQMIQSGDKNGAQQTVNKLSDEDYKTYVGIRTGERAKRTEQLREYLSSKDPKQAVDYLRSLDKDEQTRLLKVMTNKEYEVYEKAKTK